MARREVSVVIPAFNAGRYLRSALGSVLGQTWPAAEIIVVDDGSTDDTAVIAATFPGVRLIGKAHSGIAATRNAGVAEASHDYLAFLDADDLWMPEKLEKQFAFLASNPDIAGVFGKVRQFVSPELPDEERARYRVSDQEMAGYHAGALLVERQAFVGIGGFSESLAAGEFIEWMVRARQRGLDLPMLDEVVMLRRIHGANTVLSDRAALNDAYLQVIRNKLRSTK